LSWRKLTAMSGFRSGLQCRLACTAPTAYSIVAPDSGIVQSCCPILVPSHPPHSFASVRHDEMRSSWTCNLELARAQMFQKDWSCRKIHAKTPTKIRPVPAKATLRSCIQHPPRSSHNAGLSNVFHFAALTSQCPTAAEDQKRRLLSPMARTGH
jgi:hypothetical protein